MSAAAISGYLHPAYAAGFEDVGEPRFLPASGAWLLMRAVRGASDARDAMGPYPILMCLDWSRLQGDLEAQRDLVCVSAVTDPMADAGVDVLRACFPQLMRPFKDHFIADLSAPPESFIGAQHKRYARRALRSVDVLHGPAEEIDAEEFAGLYDLLMARHAVRGVARFSRQSLAMQLHVPGAVAFRAMVEGRCVGACIWYVCGERAYYHLAAYDEVGYALRASYALFWRAFEYFAARVRTLCLGAGAGLTADADDGLTQFKRGWSNQTRPAYLCGRIYDVARYRALAAAAGMDAEDRSFFPAYRRREWD